MEHNLRRLHLLVIGQIPPPTDGLAYITSEFAKLASEDHDVQIVNISPVSARRGLIYHLFRAAAVIRASLSLLLGIFRENRVCYMPCQSDFGIVYTIYLLALARLLQYPTFLHHHNFGYIVHRRLTMQIALRAGGPQLRHIFLCEDMRYQFGLTYGAPARSILISNLAFVLPNDVATSVNRIIKIGLLSNLNQAKGLHLFIDLIRQALLQGLNIEGVLAGPTASAADASALDSALVELDGKLSYVGPVYGKEKCDFYRSIDVFAFPTTYINEAQPTVVYEALTAGIPVIAYGRGCILSQVRGSGLVIPPTDAFVTPALAWLRDYAANRGRFKREMIASEMMAAHEGERKRAKSALLQIASPSKYIPSG